MDNSIMKMEEVICRLTKLETEIDELEKKLMKVVKEERNSLVSENLKQIETIKLEMRTMLPRNISLKKKNHEGRMYISKKVV